MARLALFLNMYCGLLLQMKYKLSTAVSDDRGGGINVRAFSMDLRKKEGKPDIKT